ncbi:MAG: zinc ABC transporter substrate-binding protein [Clostridia bacterium]|nr:zinc ABC transporter substrate-binding protein [Clostridia bacterium]
MKKILCLILTILTLVSLTACGGENVGSEKIQIITSLFPHYDFARQIVGDKAEVTLLLKPGMESHTYDPSTADIYKITSADLFIYTGKDMEAWVEKVIASIDKNGPTIVDATREIELLHSEHHEGDNADDHDHVYDPHIWLNPLNAAQMLDTILEAICKIDPDNESFYRENAKKYKDEILLLDSDIERTINEAKISSDVDTLVFGGKFAYAYFFDRYDLDYVSAYKTCSTETEPSLTTIYQISQYIKDNGIPCVFKEELSEGKVAKSIAEISGATVQTFSTAHNVSKEDFDRGETYVSIMYQNLNVIRRALVDTQIQ